MVCFIKEVLKNNLRLVHVICGISHSKDFTDYDWHGMSWLLSIFSFLVCLRRFVTNERGMHHVLTFISDAV